MLYCNISNSIVNGTTGVTFYTFFLRYLFTLKELLRCHGRSEDAKNLFLAVFNRTDLKKKSIIWVVFRVEFDGDIRFFVAPPKPTSLTILIDLFEVFPDFSFSHFS